LTKAREKKNRGLGASDFQSGNYLRLSGERKGDEAGNQAGMTGDHKRGKKVRPQKKTRQGEGPEKIKATSNSGKSTWRGRKPGQWVQTTKQIGRRVSRQIIEVRSEVPRELCQEARSCRKEKERPSTEK